MANQEDKPKVIKKSSRVMDVTTPGKRVPSSTSKPVIVGHTNTISADPILRNPGNEKPEPEVAGRVHEDNQEASVVETNDEPLATNENLPEAATEVSSNEEEANVTEDQTPPEETNNETTPPDTENTGVIDEIAGNVTLSKDRQDKEMAEMQASEQVNKLINSKKYYVKIKSPDSVSNFKWLVLLIGLLILGGLGWYLLLGPGKGLIGFPTKAAKSSQTTNTNTTNNSSPTPVTPPQPAYKTFDDSKINLSFKYLDSWKVTTTTDAKYPEKSLVTLTSPVENIKVATATNATPVDAEVFLRVKIYQENTQDTKKFKNELISMKNCSSEDIILGNTPMQMLYIDFIQSEPYVNRAALASDICQKVGSVYNSNDKIQLSTKKNTYVIYAEYVYGDNYLLKNGTTKDNIATAQETGVSAKLGDFKAGKNLTEFKKILTTSLKEK